MWRIHLVRPGVGGDGCECEGTATGRSPTCKGRRMASGRSGEGLGDRRQPVEPRAAGWLAVGLQGRRPTGREAIRGGAMSHGAVWLRTTRLEASVWAYSTTAGWRGAGSRVARFGCFRVRAHSTSAGWRGSGSRTIRSEAFR